MLRTRRTRLLLPTLQENRSAFRKHCSEVELLCVKPSDQRRAHSKYGMCIKLLESLLFSVLPVFKHHVNQEECKYFTGTWVFSFTVVF